MNQQTIKEFPQFELFISFYKNMGNDKQSTFSLDDFLDITSQNSELNERLREHLFCKLQSAQFIHKTVIELNGKIQYMLEWNIIQLVKELI